MSKYSNLYSVLDYLRLIFHDVFRVVNQCGHVIHSDSQEGISRVYSVANSFRTGPILKRDYLCGGPEIGQDLERIDGMMRSPA